jgi:uncharacterized NAD-dependent epimerase/dehydratase family protein
MKKLVALAEGYLADPHHGKTTRGVVNYGQDDTVAIVDSTFEGSEFQGIPVVAAVPDSLVHGPDTAVIGVAPTGGKLPPAFRVQVIQAIEGGLNIVAGMHEFLADDPELSALATQHGVELVDLRRPPEDLDVPTGANLDHGAEVVLTVGSDCAIGKMTIALELHAEMLRQGHKSVFVPTGQTGIAIAGWGIGVDAVIADYVAGASERLVVEGASRGDVLWVEGQGSLVHPLYSGVTLGLYHGSMPHHLVLCHRAGDLHIDGRPRHPIPSLIELVEIYERAALPARQAKVIAVVLNTSLLDEDAGRAAIAQAEAETGLPSGDPVRFGAEQLARAVGEAIAARQAQASHA